MVEQKIIKITENNWVKLKELEGGTMDKKLNILMDKVEHSMPFVNYSENKKSIKLYTDTLDRLDGFHITSKESRDNILTRMLLCLDEKVENVVAEWVPFKLTNPYNKLLIIEGQLEYNSKELSFNYRGNIYREKLPPQYIVEGQDLTKELYLWYDNLNWTQIIDMVCKNVSSPASYKSNNYILEVKSDLI